MDVRYYFCGRRVPHRVVVRALEALDEQVGLDSAIIDAEQAIKEEHEERRSQLLAQHPDKPELVDKLLSSRRSATDDLFRERKALGILNVISRVAEYLPEDQDIILELMSRAAEDEERG
jgi:hypothetical protein